MSKVKQAVILAGGMGKRLIPITKKVPKPLALINSIPFMDYLLESLIEIGINKVLFLVGYKYDLFIQRYGNKIGNKIVIEYSVGSVDDKTGRRLLNSYLLLDEYFLLMYGDNYWPIELEKMSSFYFNSKIDISTTVFSNKLGTGEYGFQNNIFVDKHNIVKSYDKERKHTKANGVDIGYFIVSKNILDTSIVSNLSFERDMLPPIVKKNKVGAFITDQQYYYITDVSSLQNFEKKCMINNFEPINKALLS